MPGNVFISCFLQVGSTDESKDAWSTYDVIIVGGGETHRRFYLAEEVLLAVQGHLAVPSQQG